MTADAAALAAEIRRRLHPYREETWYHDDGPLPEALAVDLLATGYGLVRDGMGEHFIDANERMGTEIVTLRARVAELEAEQARYAGVSLFSPILGEIRGPAGLGHIATGAEVSE